MTALPLMPQFVRGVINLRGSVVPVVDLNARFGRTASVLGKKSCVVVFDTQRHGERVELGLDGEGAIAKGAVGAGEPGLRGGFLGDDALQRHPPKPSGPFGEIACDINGKWRLVLAHHRQRMVAVVAIAVIEGETGEAPDEIALEHPAMGFVHGYDVDAKGAHMRQHLAQEVRCDFQMPVGLEHIVAGRADVVQHEDGADARKPRSQHMMRAGVVQRIEAGANDVIAKLLHGHGLVVNMA